MTDATHNPANAIVPASPAHAATPARSMDAVRAEVASVLDALPFRQRLTVNRQVGKAVAETITTLAAGMMQAAADAELACFEQRMTARRMDAAAMLLLNRGTLLRVVLQCQSVTTSALLDLARQHEDRIDAAAGPWVQAIRAKQAAGLITEAQAAKRLAKVEASSDALREMLEADVGLWADNFREHLRAGIEALASGRA